LTAAVVSQSLTVAVVAGILVGAGLMLSANLLAESVFIKMGDPQQIALAIQVGGFIAACQQVDSVFAATLRGLERFDAAAKAEAIAKAFSLTAIFATAYWSGDSASVLITTAGCSFVAIAPKAVAARRMLGSADNLFRFAIPERPLFRFAALAWLQGIAGVAFQQVDRLLLSTILGAAALATYSIACQVGALVHIGLSAAFAVIFPRLARRMAQPSHAEATQVFTSAWRRAILLNFFAVLLIGSFLWLLGPNLMHIWLGGTISAQVTPVFPPVLCAFLILSFNIAPHFLLLGAGNAGYVSLANSAGAFLAIITLYPLITRFGIEGAAFSRALYGAVLIAAYYSPLRQIGFLR
jgi:O-antigen/teichoic acid export membrane protein